MPVYLPVPQSVLAEARERERKQSMLSEDAPRGIDWEDTPGTDDVADKVRAAAKPCAHAVAACGGPAEGEALDGECFHSDASSSTRTRARTRVVTTEGSFFLTRAALASPQSTRTSSDRAAAVKGGKGAGKGTKEAVEQEARWQRDFNKAKREAIRNGEIPSQLGQKEREKRQKTRRARKRGAPPHAALLRKALPWAAGGGIECLSVLRGALAS